MTSCQRGFFSGSGAAVCSPCPENSYSNIVGASSCKSCPPNEMAPSGSTTCECAGNFERHDESGSCLCGPGATLVGSSCMLCETAKFKEQFGVESCASCETVISDSVTLELGASNSSLCTCPNTKYLKRAGDKCAGKRAKQKALVLLSFK